MALRLIEIQLPKSKEEETRELLKDLESASVWEFTHAGDLFFAKIVVQAEETEKLMDRFEKQYGGDQQFRLILHSLEAMIPRLKEKEAPPPVTPKEPVSIARVSREELYHDIEDACQLNTNYLIMVVLSTIVAAIGLMKHNIPAIIGAMVIAPLLGPNVALSFAATLGDLKLAAKALKVNLAGIVTAFFVTVVIGYFSRFFLAANAGVLNVSVDVTDILLALSAGAAGALAFTSGLSAILIGVMVAVALLPPLVSFGLFIGAGIFPVAWTAFLLVMVNVISVNLAGIITFHLRGVRALTWWEEGKARKLRLVATVIWLILLIILSLLIYFLDIQITPL